MRILFITGSFRKGGNTARVVRLIEGHLLDLAASEGVSLSTETINVAHRDIRNCKGCRVCFDRGEEACPLQDDIIQIRNQMLAADGIIVASPVYVNDVSGVMKTWIDRLAFVCHRPQFAGKCAYVVATVGDGPTKHALKTMRMALSFWGYDVVGQSGFKTGAMMGKEELISRFDVQSRQIASRLFKAIRWRHYQYPSFLSLMTFRIQQLYWQRNKEVSLDRTYWNNQGWIRVDRQFYIPHQANPLKVILARLAGTLLSRYVT